MTDYWECPKCLHKQVGTECRCRGPECPCTQPELSAEDRASIVRDGAAMLENLFDNKLQDRVAEALYRRGIDTLENDEAQDLALSLKLEALVEFVTELGYELHDTGLGPLPDHPAIP